MGVSPRSTATACAGRARPAIALARPSPQSRPATWQVAQLMDPSADSRGSLNRCSPSATALGTPATRLDGSRGAGGGHGPWRAIALTSSSDHCSGVCATADAASAINTAPQSQRLTSRRAHGSAARSPRRRARRWRAPRMPGMWNTHTVDAIAPVTLGHDGRPVVHAVLVLGHLGVDRHQLSRLVVLGADVEQQRERLADLDAQRLRPERDGDSDWRRSRCRCRARGRADNPPRPER